MPSSAGLAREGRRVTYVDTDVEEPNGHLFLRPDPVVEERYAVQVPVLPGGHCSGCGDCQRICAFGAIEAHDDHVSVDTRRCHSCGACALICARTDGSLAREPRELGTISHGDVDGLGFWSALLDVGEPRAAPLILGLLKAVDRERTGDGLEILDVPPGTSCAAVAATQGADRVVLVTEPTPFGHHDLELAVEMCHAAGQPMGVIINRSDLGDSREMRAYLKDREIKLLAEVPFITEVAQAYARQQLAADEVPAFRRRLSKLVRKMRLAQ